MGEHSEIFGPVGEKAGTVLGGAHCLFCYDRSGYLYTRSHCSIELVDTPFFVRFFFISRLRLSRASLTREIDSRGRLEEEATGTLLDSDIGS